eukprot:6210927-Pleurochrysis_carterae.AAC.3
MSVGYVCNFCGLTFPSCVHWPVNDVKKRCAVMRRLVSRYSDLPLRRFTGRRSSKQLHAALHTDNAYNNTDIMDRLHHPDSPLLAIVMGYSIIWTDCGHEHNK